MKRRQLKDYGPSLGRGTSALFESLADKVQADDRLRLLDPKSLPKELRGFKRRPPPNTSLLTELAFQAFKNRMWAEGEDLSDEQAARMFRGNF